MNGSSTHRPIFILGPSLTFHHGMNVGKNSLGDRRILLKLGNDGMGVCNALMDVGNDGLGAHDTTTNVGNRHIRVYCKFGLEVYT